MAPKSIAEEVSSIRQDVGQIRQDLDVVTAAVGEVGRQQAASQARSDERTASILAAIALLRDDIGRIDGESRKTQVQAAQINGAAGLARYLLPLILGLGGGAGAVELARQALGPAQAAETPAPTPGP